MAKQIVPNKIVIQEWVDALRSGEFEQIDGKLRKERLNPDGVKSDGFCCLGVLCEIAVKHKVIPPAELAVDEDGYERDWYTYQDGDFTEADSLPTVVMNWAGLDDQNPEVDYELTPEEREDWYGVSDWDDDGNEIITVPGDAPTTSNESLADLNDTRGRTFSQIADAIENAYLKKDD